MDITDTDISNVSTTDDIRPEDVEENVQDNEEQEQTENTMSDLPSTSYAGYVFGQKKKRFLLFWPNVQRIRRIQY